MNDRLRGVCLAVGLLWVSWTGCLHAQDGWKAGIARVKITPEKPLWMAGYGGRTAPSEGTFHDLWIRMLALEDAQGHRGVLVSTDTLGISQPIYRDVCRRVEAEYGLKPEQIILNASHTHCGPVLKAALYDIYPMNAQQVADVEAYSAQLTNQLVDGIGTAIKALRPAKVSRGVGTCNFAVNRRTNREPDVPRLREQNLLLGPVDHSVPVLAVHDTDNKLMAVYFLYACHNTTLSIQKWAGDYAGFAEYALEEKHPGAAALFGMGCGADQNPLPRRTLELAQDYGHRLAAAVEEVLEHGLEPVAPRLQTSLAMTPLELGPAPTRDELAKMAGKASNYVERWATRLLGELDAGKNWSREYPYPVEVWKLGDDQILVALGGEVVVEYALRLKAEHGDGVWVASYANDVMAYIPSRRVLMEGGYEGNTSMYVYGQAAHRWADDVEERIAKAVGQLVEGLK